MSQSVSATSAFVDLSTYAEMEAFIYGGPFSVTQFVGTVQKSNWFSLVPTNLKMSQEPNFGSRNVTATINRGGDYLIRTWVRFELPKVWLPDTIGLKADATVRWTSNLGHNLFSRIFLTHNEITSHELSSYFLDFYYQFNLDSSKRLGYKNMIGHVGKNIIPVVPGVALGTGGAISLPIPFWFTCDSGRAFPIAAVPFNSTKINFEFRRLNDLLIVSPGIAATGNEAKVTDVKIFNSLTEVPTIQNFETNGEYAIIHNDERVKLGDAPRDVLMRQTQQIQIQPFKDVKDNATQSFDIRLSYSIIAIYFAARNTSIQNSAKVSGGEYSNYTTEPLGAGVDPIGFVKLVYENTSRVAQPSDYFSLMEPHGKCHAIPDETGYHILSYGLRSNDINPCGSTNYSKLANVSIIYSVSDSAVNAAGSQTGIPLDQNNTPIRWPINSTNALDNQIQTFEHICVAENWNIVRFANGTLGFPTL